MISFNVWQNMSVVDYVLSHFSYFYSFLHYRRIYKNSISISINVLRNKFPIKAVLQDGTKIILKNRFDLYAKSHNPKNKYEFVNENKISVSLNDLKKTIVLETHKGSGGGIFSAFLSDTWHTHKMKNKTVIDVGAYIGDSSISFAINGAEKVIALEPLYQNYQLAKKNIQNNQLNEKIDLFLAGCGTYDHTITIDPNRESSAQADIKVKNDGMDIQIFSLKSILQNNNTNSVVLKMNCEGCEYDTILKSPEEILKKFEFIVIEYHYGYKNLKEKLEKCGFNVSIIKPIFALNKDAENNKMYIGKLYADKIN